MKKNKMFRRIASAVLALILGAVPLFLSGCHGSQGRDPFVMPEEFDMSRTYEITFWSKNDNNVTQREIYKKTIEEFEKIYPNIKVNLRPYTDYGGIYNDVITNIATDTTPNVCITYPDHIATYMTGSNVVVDLDALIDDPEYGLGGSEIRFDSPSYDDIIPEFMDECVINGSHYALPFMRSTEACYVNKTLVEKLGYTLPETLTWDFVWEVSEAAMEKDEDGNFLVNGQKVMIPFIYKSTDNMMITMLKQKDGGYSTEDGDILIFNDATREILLSIAPHAGTRSFSTFKISSYPGNFLNAGQCIFAIDSTAGSTWMGSDAPLMDIHKNQVVEFEMEVMAIPQYDTENPKMISQGPSLCIFNKKDPQEVLASWIFAQFLLTNEVQLSYSGTEGYLPVTAKALLTNEYAEYMSLIGTDTDHYEGKLKAKQLLLDNVSNTFVTPVFNGSTSLRDAAGELIENVTKSMRRGQTVDDAYLDKMFGDVSSLYRLDQLQAGRTGDVSKRDLGELPPGAVALIAVLAVAWTGIVIYVITSAVRKRKNSPDAH